VKRVNLFAVIAVATCTGVPGAWAGEGLVALQTADPACPDDSGDIYVDCGNGTVTDNRTGLVWLKDADCLDDDVSWEMATALVAGLSDLDDEFCTERALTPDQCDCDLSDGSSAGEWRLPSVDEWRVMVADAKLMSCSPSITNDKGTACWKSTVLECLLDGSSCSFENVGPIYWSGSPVVLTPGQVWIMQTLNGGIFTNNVVGGIDYVWPVRGGQ